jgi:hypothetical protein
MARGTIDEISLASSGEEISSVAAGEVLDVRGWVIPPQAAAVVAVDGSARYPLTIGDPRPDVFVALGDPAAQFAGYRAVVPTSDLQNGRHEIALIVRDQGAESVIASRTIDIRVHRPRGEGVPVGGHVDRYVDEEGIEHEVGGSTLAVPTGEVVTIRGWAADDVSRTPARGAIALVGTHVVPAVYGFERLDVGAALGDVVRFCGFSVSFPGSYVEAGGTPFKISLFAGDGRGFVPTRIVLTLQAR